MYRTFTLSRNPLNRDTSRTSKFTPNWKKAINTEQRSPAGPAFLPPHPKPSIRNVITTIGESDKNQL